MKLIQYGNNAYGNGLTGNTQADAQVDLRCSCLLISLVIIYMTSFNFVCIQCNFVYLPRLGQD